MPMRLTDATKSNRLSRHLSDMGPNHSFRTLFSLLALGFLGSVAISCTEPQQQPNIVMLNLDTLRADHLGSYGYGLETTPHMDALARRGSLFFENYAQAGWTAPSQTSLLTSTYVEVNRITQFGQELDPDVPLLAEVLQESGYATRAYSQLVGQSFERGFDEYIPREGEWETGPVDPELDQTFEQMANWAGQQTRPFFLFMHTYQVHLGYAPLEKYKRRFVSPDYDGPLRNRAITEALLTKLYRGPYELTDADRDYIVALYDALLAHLDDAIGSFLESLDKLRLRDNTIVVIVSDHGEEFNERGRMARHATLYNEVIRTPLIIAGPGVPVKRIFRKTVRNIDVAPTLLSLAGIEIPDLWQGTSLEPIWSRQERKDREVLAQHNERAILITDKFKIWSNGHLFDLKSDPGELVNAKPARPVKARRLRKHLAAMLAEMSQESSHIVGPVQLNEQDLRKLRALGYVQ